LNGGRQAGTGDWLVGTKPGLVDVHAFMNPWFIEKNVPDFLNRCFETAPLTRDWYQRLKAFSGPAPEILSGPDALDIALRAAPRLKPASTVGELQDFQPGHKVAVAPDDYAKDWVEGDLVIANAERVIIARQNEQVDTIHVHFPRVGYVVRMLS
ncbi:MAG: glutathione binding-like protein, partial [Pseudomonadota bacterium]